jgi:hypothetical protein
MRRIIFLFLLSFLSVKSFADSQLTDHLHDIDYSNLSDANVCSWFQVIPVPEDYINEARKRGLTCGGVSYSNNATISFSQNNKIPPNSHAYLSSWVCNTNFYRNESRTGCLPIPANSSSSYSSNYFSCNPGYKLSLSDSNSCVVKVPYYKTVPKTYPENAHADGSNGWACDAFYIKSGSKCVLEKQIPSNAYASDSVYVGWRCNSGYYKKGSRCLKLPKYAEAYKSGYDGFYCKDKYYKDFNTCKKLPQNAANYGMQNSGGFYCEKGYKKNNSGNGCIRKKIIPSNAYASGNTQGWQCNSGYYQNYKRCSRLPANAAAYEPPTIEGFRCNSGYKKNGNSCVKKKIAVPPNAYASGLGWKCNPGYEKQGNSCSEIQDDTIYQAGSGSGFATTSDGHILTNYHVIDGCSEVALVKSGKSYLTTVITQDPNNDLAILQSDFKPTKVYSLSNEVYLSDDIFAAGFPFGNKISSAITINKGIISALMGPGDDISIFQIDAVINSGNSGGPIVDKRGNAVGIAVSKLNKERAKEELKLGSIPEGFNFAVNSMMAIGLFRSQGIEIPPQNNNELSVKERNDLFNQGTFYLSCGMTIAQYEKMAKTDKVMFTKDVFFSNFEGN